MTSMADDSGLTRRGFLTTTATAAAGAALGGLTPRPAAAAGPVLSIPGKLVRVSNPAVVKGGKVKGRKRLDGAVAKQLVERALVEFTGAASPVEALGKFVSKDDVVGLKVNCLGSPGMATHPDITFAVVDLLKQLGVGPDAIIVYDQYGSRMRKGGYKLVDRKGKVRVIRHWGSSSSREDPKWGYQAKTSSPAGPTRFCKVLDRVTAIISLPVPKDHDLTGVTGALKNVAFGHIDVVPKFHCNKGYGWVDGKRVKQKGTCQPECKWGACNVARLYSHPPLRDKVRLHVADATAVLYQGGPQYKAKWTEAYGSVIVATDPVAMDSYFLRIIDEHRARKKMKPIDEVRRPRARPALFIRHAEALGLGIADPAKQDLKEVALG